MKRRDTEGQDGVELLTFGIKCLELSDPKFHAAAFRVSEFGRIAAAIILHERSIAAILPPRSCRQI